MGGETGSAADDDMNGGAVSAEMVALKTTIQRMQEAALIVQRKQPPDGAGNEPNASLSVLRKALLKVKSILRRLAHEMQAERERTEAAMAQEDAQALALKNLLYELDHYRRTTRATENFQSEYPDLEILSLQEFMLQTEKKAPESEDQAHAIEIQRLQAERKRREELEERKNSLQKRKRELTKLRDDGISFEDSLKLQLRALRDSALLVQTVFPEAKRIRKGVYSDQILLYNKLPTPLYILYTHLMSAREILNENIELRIKRENAETTTENTSETKTMQLSVIVKIQCPCAKGTTTLTLQFMYMEDLDVVTVVSEDIVLKNLFPQDGGTEIPSTAAAKPASLDQMQGTPFKWCQLLAGMDFIPLLPSNSLESRQSFMLKAGEQGRAQIVLKRIRARYANMLALEKEIENIVAALPKKSTSSSSKKPSMVSFVKRAPNRTDDVKSVVGEEGYDFNNLQCVCNTEIKLAASRFGARIYIDCNYPEVRPLFRLSVLERPTRATPPNPEAATDVCLNNEDALGQEVIHLEAKVNCVLSEENILTAQLESLMTNVREVVHAL